MKVYLDDERTPGSMEGCGAKVEDWREWVVVRRVEDAIALLKTGLVTEISLNHDLGLEQYGTGYDVLLWIEEKVHDGASFTDRGTVFKCPIIHVHTANSSASQKMEAAVKSIEKQLNSSSFPRENVL